MVQVSFDPDTLDGALEAGSRNKQSEWIQAHLQLPLNKNDGLAKGLQLVKTRAYLGPIKISLSDLYRACGPEPGMKYPEDKAIWDPKIELLVRRLREGWNPPPLIVAGDIHKPLYVADGNHRLAALQQFGKADYWAILYFDNDAAKERYIEKYGTGTSEA